MALCNFVPYLKPFTIRTRCNLNQMQELSPEILPGMKKNKFNFEEWDRQFVKSGSWKIQIVGLHLRALIHTSLYEDSGGANTLKIRLLPCQPVLLSYSYLTVIKIEYLTVSSS